MACQCQSVAVLGLREGRVCLVCLCSFVARSRRSAPFVYLIVIVTDLLSSNSFSEKIIESSLYGLYQTDRWESDRKQLSTSPSRDRQDILIARVKFQAQPWVTYDGPNMCQERQPGSLDSCKERRERRYVYLTLWSVACRCMSELTHLCRVETAVEYPSPWYHWNTRYLLPFVNIPCRTCELTLAPSLSEKAVAAHDRACSDERASPGTSDWR
jgi:hypothetical protein